MVLKSPLSCASLSALRHSTELNHGIPSRIFLKAFFCLPALGVMVSVVFVEDFFVGWLICFILFLAYLHSCF